MPDIQIEREGSLFIFTAETDQGAAWLQDHIEPDAPWLGCRTVVVEARFAQGLAQGMLDDGLKVE